MSMTPTKRALKLLNDADDQHLGDLESFAELFTRLAERREDTFTSKELVALAFALERHAEGVALAIRSAVETLRLGTDPHN